MSAQRNARSRLLCTVIGVVAALLVGAPAAPAQAATYGFDWELSTRTLDGWLEGATPAQVELITKRFRAPDFTDDFNTTPPTYYWVGMPAAEAEKGRSCCSRG
jgi:hypothetical protein